VPASAPVATHAVNAFLLRVIGFNPGFYVDRAMTMIPAT
jgi:hypothetical protein